MSRESAAVKGARYLIEGRLIVRVVQGDYIEATCRGAGELHHLGHRNGTWWCSCPARGQCAHLVALQAVTARKSKR